jgi:uncharacterized OsmC-like protein
MSDEVRVVNEAELDHGVRVRTGRDRYRTDVAVRGHPIVVDEPPKVGGGDMGPSPFELLCAALGACTTITLRMYADRKGWPLEEILVRVEHSRDRSGEEGVPPDLFRIELQLLGALDGSQRERLHEIAGKCPVHRTLVGGSRVEMVTL